MSNVCFLFFIFSENQLIQVIQVIKIVRVIHVLQVIHIIHVIRVIHVIAKIQEIQVIHVREALKKVFFRNITRLRYNCAHLKRTKMESLSVEVGKKNTDCLMIGRTGSEKAVFQNQR